MKAITILPNFTVVADKSHPDYYGLKKNGLVGRLLTHCVPTSEGEQVDMFKITPDSLWYGMNVDEGADFIAFLKEHTENIPENVLIDLNMYVSRFGVISLVGDDCIRVNDPELLKEVLNNTSIKEKIYEQDGNLIFFHNISFVEFQSIFSREIGYPIKVRRSRVRTFYVKLNENNVAFTIKACTALEALKSLYGKHNSLNEESLRKRLKLKREITAEDIARFIEVVLTEDQPIMSTVNHHTVFSAVKFLL